MSGGRVTMKVVFLLAIVALIGKYAPHPGAISATGDPPAVAADTSVPAGNVQEWIGQADQVLEQNGTPVAALNDHDVFTIIQHESGGNPAAVNRSDSNAAAGDPSKGLMQTTTATFQAHKLPGHNDIYNPVDNIIAGVRYAITRYGSLANVPGVRAVNSGRGYVGY